MLKTIFKDHKNQNRMIKIIKGKSGIYRADAFCIKNGMIYLKDTNDIMDEVIEENSEHYLEISEEEYIRSLASRIKQSYEKMQTMCRND